MTEAAGPVQGTPAYDAVVLAGGAARRLGGADKPGVRVGGRALLDRVLAACAGARNTVVVAAPRPTARPVHWAREEPVGGGPLAALEAGALALGGLEGGGAGVIGPGSPGSRDAVLDGPGRPDSQATDPHAPHSPEHQAARLGAPRDPESQDAGPDTLDTLDAPESEGDGLRAPCSQEPRRAESLVVLSADLPFLRERTVRLLLTALDTQGADGVLLVDGDGRDQPLVAAYRKSALHRVLAALRTEHGALTGLPLRLLVRGLEPVRITDPVASFDCDTWDDIAAARSRIREHGHVLDEWISAAKDELGIDLDVDTGVLLDLARDAAHGVARPAAPLTTFLVGYAAAQAGGGPEAVSAAAVKAAALANRWAREAESESTSGPASSEPGPAAPEPGAPAPDAARDVQ